MVADNGCPQPGSGGLHSEAFLEGDGPCVWCGLREGDVKLEPGTEVLETAVIDMGDGRWFAGLKIKVPGQGGYDRAPDDDVFRTFEGEDAEKRAREWLAEKLLSIKPLKEERVPKQHTYEVIDTKRVRLEAGSRQCEAGHPCTEDQVRLTIVHFTAHPDDPGRVVHHCDTRECAKATCEKWGTVMSPPCPKPVRVNNLPAPMPCSLPLGHAGDCDALSFLKKEVTDLADRLLAQIKQFRSTFGTGLCSDGRTGDCDWCAEDWITFQGLAHRCITCSKPVLGMDPAIPCCIPKMGVGGDA